MLDCWGRCQWTKKMLKGIHFSSWRTSLFFTHQVGMFDGLKILQYPWALAVVAVEKRPAGWNQSRQIHEALMWQSLTNRCTVNCLTDPNLNRNQSCWIVLTSSTKLSLRFRPAARSFGAFSSSSLARSSFVQSCSVDLSALSQNWQIAIAHCLWRWVNRSLTCSFRIWMISHLIWKEEKKKPAC